ncbi:acyltransferase [Klebsormidium nitens]|uniref:Acyltransferase n=1 Tax=Klebsormidium nitens TaxID=105231 RepID=A0A1Y1I8S3_KLENI|nr:acyltransferase [Klebsormidium nitens]|eukprot:GAQ85809.1 acyltransferase [Klebsormidium nitens]
MGVGAGASELRNGATSIASGTPNGTNRQASDAKAREGSKVLAPPTPAQIAVLEKQYPAFARTDIYGPMGAGPLSIVDTLRLWLGGLILFPLRLLVVVIIVFIYYLICRITLLRLHSFKRNSGPAAESATGLRRTIIVESGKRLARAVLFVIGFYHIKKVKRAGGERTIQATGIVSNHVSWIDILYHMSDTFPSFVAKKGTLKVPMVGLISQCLGCIYVDRETAAHVGVSTLVKNRMLAVAKDPAAAPVLLFPEGTTTNGRHLLPFKTGAFLAGTPVQPYYLHFPHRRFNPAWETVSALRHMFLLLSQLVNHLEVTELPVYKPSLDECRDPHKYAQRVRDIIAKEGKLLLSSHALYEKRCYHAALLGKEPPPPPTKKAE